MMKLTLISTKAAWCFMLNHTTWSLLNLPSECCRSGGGAQFLRVEAGGVSVEDPCRYEAAPAAADPQQVQSTAASRWTYGSFLLSCTGLNQLNALSGFSSAAKESGRVHCNPVSWRKSRNHLWLIFLWFFRLCSRTTPSGMSEINSKAFY